MHNTTPSIAELEPMPATNQGPPLNSPKAQTILVMGIMGYQRGTLTPYSCHASAAFDNVLAKAKKRGFKASKQLKGAVRRGKATKFAMEKVQMMADFVTDAELAEQQATLTFWDRLRRY
jgi:hypothetical protein